MSEIRKDTKKELLSCLKDISVMFSKEAQAFTDKMNGKEPKKPDQDESVSDLLAFIDTKTIPDSAKSLAELSKEKYDANLAKVKGALEEAFPDLFKKEKEENQNAKFIYKNFLDSLGPYKPAVVPVGKSDNKPIGNTVIKEVTDKFAAAAQTDLADKCFLCGAEDPSIIGHGITNKNNPRNPGGLINCIIYRLCRPCSQSDSPNKVTVRIEEKFKGLLGGS